MKPKEETQSQKPFKKEYSVAIDTVPLPERPEKRIQLVMEKFTPVINQIIADAMSVAIGTWPTPETPKKLASNFALLGASIKGSPFGAYWCFLIAVNHS